jgi:tetratricopeptide (TPR) repeat protein
MQLTTSEGFAKAMEYIGQALKIDPLFLPGYHGLTEIYIISTFFGNVPPNIAYPKAKEYAEKALEIDDKFSDAYRIKGLVCMYYDWNFEAAEQHIKYALKLNPNGEWIHHSYSQFLTSMGRHAEAIVEAERAVELDPLSAYFSAHLGNININARQFDQAINHLSMTITTFPDYYLGHLGLGMAYRCALKMNEAIKEYNIAMELSNEVPLTVSLLACALYETGRKEEAERLINKLKKKSEKEYVPAIGFSDYYMAKGDYDKAYEYVEQAIREHDGFILHNIASPITEYRIPTDEPRFAELLKKAGLERFTQNEET